MLQEHNLFMKTKQLSWARLVDHAATAWQPYYVVLVWLAITWVSAVFLLQVILEVSSES
jgi:hypothetical protein